MNVPMMIPSVRAALCSRFIFMILRSLVGVEPTSCSVNVLLDPPLHKNTNLFLTFDYYFDLIIYTMQIITIVI